MLNIEAKIRKDLGRKVKNLRKKGQIPAVLYGPKIETISIEVDLKEFEKVYKTEGESSLITLEIGTKKYLVLIHALELDVISQKPIHVDFYQPRLDEEITAVIPLIFEGEARAVKDSGGTLVRNIQELTVKALPQNLPHEIKVNIEKLKTFEDSVLIKDLFVPEGVKILKEQNEIVAQVLPPQKVEEELAKPIEEKVEEVEKAGEKKEKEETEKEEISPKQPTEQKSAK